jgi:hypothetical protein
MSASKVVFIIMAGGSLALTVLKIMDVKDFFVLVSMAFSFYFSNKGDSSQEFLGK